MLRRKSTVGATVLVAVLLALALAFGQRGRWAGSTDSVDPALARPAVETVRLTPPGDPGVEIECPSFAFVDFTYQIFNRGDLPLTGLKLATKCACEAIGSPPAEILPGESASISFRVRAPLAGKMHRQIPLSIDGASEPLVLLDASLRVKFESPALLPLPGDLRLTFVKGDGSARKLVFEAIEAKRDKHWICGLELNPPDNIEVHPPQVEELIETDPDLTRRRYRFPLVNRSLQVGRHAATAMVRTRDDSPPTQNFIILLIDVVDSMAIVPNPLVITYSGKPQAPPRRVNVVHRTGAHAAATPVSYNHDLLHVEAAGPQSGLSAAFDITPAETPDLPTETQAVFDVGENETRVLARLPQSAEPILQNAGDFEG